MWAALILALGGLSLVVDLWSGVALDGPGVLAALASAVTFALYILLAESAVSRRDPVSLLALGFTFAAIFWAVVQPWWSFPTEYLDDRIHMDGAVFSSTLPVWALLVGVVLVGTIVPFLLLVGALRHINATRAGVTAMFEPVAGALVAWAWLGESLTTRPADRGSDRADRDSARTDRSVIRAKSGKIIPSKEEGTSQKLLKAPTETMDFVLFGY